MFKGLKLITAFLVISNVFITGCAPTPYTQTIEQQAQAQAILQQMLTNNQKSSLNAPAQQQAPIQVVTEQQLAAQIAQLPQSAQGVKFERVREGFKAGGNLVIDPVGEIVNYGTNYQTGDVTYIARVSQNEFVLKYMRINSGFEAIDLATATRESGLWRVRTATGKNLNGDKLIPTSKGFIVARESTAFNYIVGQGITNFASVDGFHIADFQNGDIASTSYILLERDKPSADSNELFGQLKSLGNTLGINKKQDYLLVNLSSGKSYPIDVSIEGKETGEFYNCSRQNSYVQKCDGVNFKESLYQQNGSKNNAHYFWRISWVNTGSGPFLIAQENGTKEINIQNLNTGKKAQVFQRTLGINEFSVNQDADGIVAISATLGFSNEIVPNMEMKFAEVIAHEQQANSL